MAPAIEGERLASRPDFAVARRGVVRVSVGEDGPRHSCRGIDVGLEGWSEEAFRADFEEGKEPVSHGID
jgi:hypothetical protein